MKRYVIFVLQTLLCTTLFGQGIGIERASRYAQIFMDNISSSQKSIRFIGQDTLGGVVCLYHVEFTDSSWCIMSADSDIPPVLAYGFSLPNEEEDYPFGYLNLIERYKEQISRHILNSENDHREESSLNMPRTEAISEVKPLLYENRKKDLIWKQAKNNNGGCNPSYNRRCPEHPINIGGCECDRTHVGCAAVALGSIMWYWQWPRKSSRRTYQWELIPPNLYDNTPGCQADEIAGYLRDCGEACDMMYSCLFGSGAWQSDIYDAFVHEMNYKAAEDYEASEWGSAWSDLIKSEIDNGRPVLMYGDNGTVINGHYFVIDGYREDEYYRLFYVNWGHGGGYNGLFRIDNLYEGSDYYNCNNEALLSLSPTYEDDTISSVNYTEVPYNHRRVEYAYNHISLPDIGNTLKVKTHGSFLLEAGDEIELLPGFEAEMGSEVEVRVNPQWLSHMEIDVSHWPNSVQSNGYTIEVKNADSWEFRLFDLNGNPVFCSAGSVQNGYAYLWDGYGVAPGMYVAYVVFKNSYGRSLNRQMTLSISGGLYSNSIVNNSSEQPLELGDSDFQEVSCLGTESIDPEDLSSLICLNPNPANHEVVVSSCASISVVEVYSAVGGLVFSSSDSQEIIQKDVNTIFLDVKSWPRGTYLLRIQTPMGVVTKKLLVQ